MRPALHPSNDFETEVAHRFGILPNFFRSAQAAPELIQQLWGFAKASLEKQGAFCSIRMRDTGVGFDQKFATELFEPFTQAEQSLDRPNGGLGLGLAIASGLTTLQGGSLTAASAGLQEGATFTLQLALVEA